MLVTRREAAVLQPGGCHTRQRGHQMMLRCRLPKLRCVPVCAGRAGGMPCHAPPSTRKVSNLVTLRRLYYCSTAYLVRHIVRNHAVVLDGQQHLIAVCAGAQPQNVQVGRFG